MMSCAGDLGDGLRNLSVITRRYFYEISEKKSNSDIYAVAAAL